MEEHKYNQPRHSRYRESDSSNDRAYGEDLVTSGTISHTRHQGGFPGKNRFDKERIRHDSFQDDQFRNDYDPTYEDQYEAKRSRWSEDLRSDASRENYFGKGPKGYKRSIKRIKDEACEILARDFDLDASDIEVEIKDDIIFLNGYVASRQDKKRAESLVEDISGIDDVQNQLQVKKNCVEGWIPGIGSIEDET